jgi:hypothetical protein
VQEFLRIPCSHRRPEPALVDDGLIVSGPARAPAALGPGPDPVRAECRRQSLDERAPEERPIRRTHRSRGCFFGDRHADTVREPHFVAVWTRPGLLRIHPAGAWIGPARHRNDL